MGYKYYAVVVGRHPGIYDSWKNASAQVASFPNKLFKGFSQKAEAEAFFAEWQQRSKCQSSFSSSSSSSSSAAALPAVYWHSALSLNASSPSKPKADLSKGTENKSTTSSSSSSKTPCSKPSAPKLFSNVQAKPPPRPPQQRQNPLPRQPRPAPLHPSSLAGLSSLISSLESERQEFVAAKQKQNWLYTRVEGACRGGMCHQQHCNCEMPLAPPPANWQPNRLHLLTTVASADEDDLYDASDDSEASCSEDSDSFSEIDVDE